MSHSPKRQAFTLIELMVVIGIIALLISILLPSLSAAREAANKTKCANNLRQIGNAFTAYANDNKGSYPRLPAAVGVNPILNERGAAYGFVPFTEYRNNPGGYAGDANSPGMNNIPGSLFLLIHFQQVNVHLHRIGPRQVLGMAAGNPLAKLVERVVEERRVIVKFLGRVDRVAGVAGVVERWHPRWADRPAAAIHPHRPAKQQDPRTDDQRPARCLPDGGRPL